MTVNTVLCSANDFTPNSEPCWSCSLSTRVIYYSVQGAAAPRACRGHACLKRPPCTWCLLWWCHAPEQQRRWRRHWALDEDVAGAPYRGLRLKRCGIRQKDDEQRGRRFAVSFHSRRCYRVREYEGKAGSPAQLAGEAAHIQRAERPEERALPASPKLPVQRAGETQSLGVHLPCVCVSLFTYLSMFGLCVVEIWSCTHIHTPVDALPLTHRSSTFKAHELKMKQIST